MRPRSSIRFATLVPLVLSAAASGAVAAACGGDEESGPDANTPAGAGGTAGASGAAGGAPGCGAGGACQAAACQLGGANVAAGTIDPANACAQCDPARSRDAWSPRPDGTACADGKICLGGACEAKCSIDGVARDAGEANPANPCERCDPATSATAWSAAASGTACAGGRCEAGACVTTCTIDGKTYEPGALNPANICQQCAPETSTTAWSTRATAPLLVGGTDVTTQGWTVSTGQVPASVTYGPDYVRVATSTAPGATTSGQLMLVYPGAYEPGKPFTVRAEVLVESVTPHNQADSGAALLGAFTPSFGTPAERAQMVYLDGAQIGWADDSQSAAAAVLNAYRTYELSVDAAGVARVSVDGAAALTRSGFVPNGTIALGDQTNDPNVDGVMRIRSVTKVCP